MRSPGAGAGTGAGASDIKSLSVTNDADPAGDRGEGSGVGAGASDSRSLSTKDADADPAGDRGEGSGVGTVLSYLTAGSGEPGGEGGGSITSEPVQGPA